VAPWLLMTLPKFNDNVLSESAFCLKSSMCASAMNVIINKNGHNLQFITS